MIYDQAISPEERRRVAESIAESAGWRSLEHMRAAMLRIPRAAAPEPRSWNGWSDRAFPPAA